MKNAFSCLLAILWPFLNAFCQPPARPLTVGDAVPDYLIRNLVNYKTPTARLSDFKDKLLILDFMASNCSSCIVNLFRMDSLESTYKTQLQVLPVSYESKLKLQAFLQKGYLGKKVTAPFVSQDSVLRSWFPHQFISHMVWIHNGIVKAITKPEYVKAANIEAVLGNERVNWPVKRDVGIYDPAYPLLTANSEAVAAANQSTLRYYSVLPGYMEGFASTSTVYADSVNGVTRLSTINHSIIQLYLLALGLPLHFPPTYIIVEAKDSTRFFYNSKDYRYNWERQNNYCYQACLPATMPEEMKKEKMRADLDFYLGLHGRLEKRMVKCMVLKRDSTITPITEKPTTNPTHVIGIAKYQNRQLGNLPWIDEVADSKSLYITGPQNPADVAALSQQLLLYGIRLVHEMRELEMVVISDAQPNH